MKFLTPGRLSDDLGFPSGPVTWTQQPNGCFVPWDNKDGKVHPDVCYARPDPTIPPLPGRTAQQPFGQVQPFLLQRPEAISAALPRRAPVYIPPPPQPWWRNRALWLVGALVGGIVIWKLARRRRR